MQDSATTIQDIAKRANVSKSTVSRVMNNSSIVNEEKRTAVLTAMQALNYQPSPVARGLAGGKSMTIGILTQLMGSPFYGMVSEGIVNELKGTGYSPIFVDGLWQAEAEEAVIRTLLGRKVDGLILVGGNVSEAWLNRLRERVPTLVVGRNLPGWENRSVFIDNFAGGYDATKFLIDAGHRSIAHVMGVKSHPDALDRRDGYRKALEEAGIEYNPDLVVEGTFVAQSGVVAVESLLMKGLHFSAIFAANDMMAFGVRLALSRRGIRVPDDVSIIGFDDQKESAFMTPPLTTVRQPAAEMGEAVANAMVKLLGGEAYEMPRLAAELKIRESVSRIR